MTRSLGKGAIDQLAGEKHPVGAELDAGVGQGDFHISGHLIAVHGPLRDDEAGTSSTMAISMSVAVSVSLPSRTAIITLARMGMVLRRSTIR
jgi:hypothetical protein